MCPTPFYGAGAETPLQKADFAMKQILCRLSGVKKGDIKKQTKKDKLGPEAPRGVDPHSPNFQGM